MKVRTAAGLKTVSAMHVRTAAGAGGLKTVTDAHVRIGAGGTNLKDFWTPGGGPGSVSVAPPSTNTSSATSRINASDFTATFGGVPTVIAWSVANQSNCAVSIISGQGTATARVQITVDHGSSSDRAT
jgi:hypothetical protein